MSARRSVFCTSSKTWQIRLPTLVWKRTSNSYNISSFWIYLRLITVWEHIKICIIKYSRNNQKSYDEDFNQLESRFRLSQNSLPILFSQCKVSLLERNTHDVSGLLANVAESCCSISAQKTTKQIFFTICWQSAWKHRLGQCTRCTTNELLVRIRLPFKNFCKVAKRAETTRNYQNTSWLW